MKLSNLEKQASSLGRRYYTLQLVFNLFKSLRASSIVQVGCQSRDSEYANFDLFQIFAELNEKKKKSIYKIYCNIKDNKKRVEEIQKEIYKNYSEDKIQIKELDEYNKDSIKYIDLLILNDINYPINELTKEVSKELNYLEARNLLSSFSEKEINARFGGLIDSCREKMLFDYKTFKSRLSRSAIVLLEGEDYPGGSQTLLVKRQLESDGFICLLNLKQSIWIRR